MKKIVVIVALLAFAGWMGGAVPASAGSAIANGSGLYMGVNDEGHHNISSPAAGLPANSGFLGLAGTFPDGTVRDATSPGCQCEGWGVAGNGIAGFANVSVDGVINLTVDSFTTAGSVATPFGDLPTSATSSVHLTSLPDLGVTHVYSPSAVTPYLFVGDVSITNSGVGPIAGTEYRRVMDWDIPPDEFNEFVTHGGLPAANVQLMGDNGFASANPLDDASASFEITPGTFNVNFTDAGPDDHGTVIDFIFGDLAPGETRSFKIFYGAAPSESLAFAALGAVGAEVFSLGQYSGDPAGGTPLTYIFAFAGVGGTPIEPPGSVPEPATLILLGSGLLGVMGARRFRRS